MIQVQTCHGVLLVLCSPGPVHHLVIKCLDLLVAAFSIASSLSGLNKCTLLTSCLHCNDELEMRDVTKLWATVVFIRIRSALHLHHPSRFGWLICEFYMSWTLCMYWDVYRNVQCET